MLPKSGIPRYIPPHQHTRIFVRKLTAETYDELLSLLKTDELLFALFDLPLTAVEIEEEKAQIADIPPGEMGYGTSPHPYRTLFMRIESQEEFLSQPWILSGWVWFYAVPQWLARE